MLKKILYFYICLILLLLPLYLLKLKIWLIPFTVLELMIYGLFTVWVFYKIKNYKVSGFGLRVSGYKYPAFLIFFGAAVSTLFSDDPQISAGILKGWFFSPLLFFFVFLDVIKSRKQIRNILVSLTLSGLFVSLVSLWYWLENDLTYDGRLSGFYLSPNHLSMYLAPILILSFGLWRFTKAKWQRIFLFIVYSFLFFIIYLTYSQGAWLGLAGAFVFLLLKTKRRSKNKLFLWLILLLVISSIFFFQFQSSWISLGSRLIIWRAAAEIIKDHPFIGIGPGLFLKYYLDEQTKFGPYLDWAVPQPHNLFLAFWLQTGLIGLIGFFWLIIVFFRIIHRTYIELFYVLVMAMIYTLVHGLIDTPYWKNDLAIIFWLVIALASITNRLFYLQKKDNPLEEIREVS